MAHVSATFVRMFLWGKMLILCVRDVVGTGGRFLIYWYPS